ncbi:hypothetical protein JTE90_023569 [Oedothorax gibbosus]|uniref:Uncharacterized protein n=1 Tax=Oedothorax gibbosus TaxID=931172 RepID=A0AAV6UCQ5_9ARAC|nr:hypothetical protein JTE90_023569 [Oedothorax gibbosus]
MFSELEEMVGSGSAMKGSYHDFGKSKTVSSITTKSIRNNLPDSLFRSTRFAAQKQLHLDCNCIVCNSKTVSSASTKSSLSNVPKLTVRSSRAKAERELDQDYKNSETASYTSTKSSFSKIPKSTVHSSRTKVERELDQDNNSSKTVSSASPKSSLSNIPDLTVRSSRAKAERELYQDYKKSKTVQSASTKISLSKIPKSTVHSSRTKVERELDQDNNSSKTVSSASTKSSLSKIPKSTECSLGTKAERELDQDYNNSETVSSTSTKSSYDNFPESTVRSSSTRAELELDKDYNNSKIVSSASMNKVSVLLEDEIFNKHERQDKEGPKGILKAPNVKIEFDAKQKSELQGLVERLLSPTYSDDDNQEDIIFVKATEKEILEARDRILRKSLQMEKELDEIQKSIKVQPISECRIGTVDECQAETRIPLMPETTVTDLNNKSEGDEKKSVDIHLSEIRKELSDRRNADVVSKERSSCRPIVLSSLCFAALSIVPIAMVVIGSLYLKECPVQPYIPIYLVVGGAFGIFYNFISVYRRNTKSVSYNVFDGIMNLFFVIWFIIGCVWVYSIKHVEFYVTTDSDYCHHMSSAERGESVELKDRIAAPPETRVPLMSAEDIKKEEERLEKEHKRLEKQQKQFEKEHKLLVKDMKEITKDIEEMSRWQKTQKYGANVYMSTTPVVSVIMIVIGSIYLEDCTVQPYIPIYLVVAASLGIFVNVMFLSWKCCCVDSKVCEILYYGVSGLISIFSIVWYILGCVWIYGVQDVEFEDTFSENYCHKTLYYFAFWLLNVTFILLGLCLILGLCLCCTIAVLNVLVTNDEIDE